LGQQPSCGSLSDCPTCLVNGCYYNANCGCTDSASQCPLPTVHGDPSQCPAAPAIPLSPAYLWLGLGVIAAFATGVLSYCPCERACGHKPSRARDTSFVLCSPHALFISSSCLWFGVSLGIAAPSLPWLVSAGTGATSFANAFFYTVCNNNQNGAEFCTSMNIYQYLTSSQASSTDVAYGLSALALGASAYICAVGLLLPCAVMASVAVYRLRRCAMYGTPPYTAGCSPASLLVAQLLGWSAFVAFGGACVGALALCAMVVPLIQANPRPTFSLTPGPVAAGLSAALQLVGLILMAASAWGLSDVRGVGCNSGGCCRTAAREEPAREVLLPNLAHAPLPNLAYAPPPIEREVPASINNDPEDPARRKASESSSTLGRM
jgi:hypothetical protein